MLESGPDSSSFSPILWMIVYAYMFLLVLFFYPLQHTTRPVFRGIVYYDDFSFYTVRKWNIDDTFDRIFDIICFIIDRYDDRELFNY